MREALAALQPLLWPDAREFTIPVYFDYFATFTWAVSGIQYSGWLRVFMAVSCASAGPQPTITVP